MIEKSPNPQRVLVTGSTGAIGQPVCERLLARGHHVRGFARRPTPGLEDFVIGDLNDQAKVREAVEGMDCIINLGAYPNPADFVDVLLQPNVVGLYYICEAAAEYKVKRLVLATTLQVVTGHNYRETGKMVRIEDGPAPVNHYGLTKAWAEIAGDMYARVYGLSVISVRIGWLPRNPSEAERLVASGMGKNVFLSHNDAATFHQLCVESPTPAPGESAILFATSRPADKMLLDLEPATRVIGYEPEDVWPEGLPYALNE